LYGNLLISLGEEDKALHVFRSFEDRRRTSQTHAREDVPELEKPIAKPDEIRAPQVETPPAKSDKIAAPLAVPVPQTEIPLRKNIDLAGSGFSLFSEQNFYIAQAKKSTLSIPPSKAYRLF
jgi:hypothetical protein